MFKLQEPFYFDCGWKQKSWAVFVHIQTLDTLLCLTDCSASVKYNHIKNLQLLVSTLFLELKMQSVDFEEETICKSLSDYPS